MAKKAEVKEKPETEITSIKPTLTPDQLMVHDTGEYAMLFDTARFNQAWRIAQAFAASGLVPNHFKNNTPGVFVVLHMATRMNLDPFMVLQKTYMVNQRPGIEAQLVIALVNARGPFTGPIQWETSGAGDTRQWTAYAIHKATGERCEATVTWAMVKAEGWSTKAGSKWLTLPDLMGRYRSATFLARLYCPEVIMGLSTADELEDSIITLDTGVEVSRSPRTALPEPPTPPVDPELLAEFDRLIGKKKETMLAAGQVRAFKTFLEETAKVQDISIDELKVAAAPKFEGFWEAFEKWFLTQPKGTRASKTKEAPPAHPEGGVGGEGVRTPGFVQEASPVPNTPPPVTISAEHLAAIRLGLKEKGLTEEMVFQDWKVSDLEELDRDSAKSVLEWIESV